MSHKKTRLYNELASWWHLLSPPEYYAEEAELYRKAIMDNSSLPPKTMLELGSGGGNNASHLKTSFKMTLVDLSTEMLSVSRSINPDCEHIQGDMRSIRLNRVFDAVFIQDAIAYMATEADLRLAIKTAFEHCRPGGVALFAPDYTSESFFPSTYHDGHDKGDNGMRYLEWIYDPDPCDNRFTVDFAFLLKSGQDVRCEYDRHICGLFSQKDWLKIITDTGFKVKTLPFEHSLAETDAEVIFAGIRSGDVP